MASHRVCCSSESVVWQVAASGGDAGCPGDTESAERSPAPSGATAASGRRVVRHFREQQRLAIQDARAIERAPGDGKGVWRQVAPDDAVQVSVADSLVAPGGVRSAPEALRPRESGERHPYKPGSGTESPIACSCEQHRPIRGALCRPGCRTPGLRNTLRMVRR